MSIPVKERCTVWEDPNAMEEVVYDDSDSEQNWIEYLQNLYVFKFNDKGDPVIVIGPDCKIILFLISILKIYLQW